MLALPIVASGQDPLPAGGAAAAEARLTEILAVIRGTPAQRRAFIAERRDSVYAPAFRQRQSAEANLGWLNVVAGSGDPPELRVRPRPMGDGGATALLWSPLREEFDSLWVTVERTPPHRILTAGFAPGVRASGIDVTSEAELADHLDRYVTRLAGAGAFSGVVGLARDGRLVFAKAYGLAQRDFDVPNRLDTRFNLGSLNKTFTALVIAQLVEEGRLAWTDPLSRFVPDFPNREDAGRIQIRHLLAHTSGLGSYFNEKFFQSSRDRWRTVDDHIELARPDSLQFAPGARWAYSNTGYVLLGKVIEVVTGQSYFDAVADRVYGRAGMTQSGSYALDEVNTNLAVGYSRDANGEYSNNLFTHVIQGGPAGGGYSTLGDLLRLSRALEEGRIVGSETLHLMRTPKPEIGSGVYGYGFLLWLGPDIWGHGGDFPGIDADWHHLGDSGWTVVILANQSGVNPPILRRVRSLVAQAPPPQRPTAGAIIAEMHERHTRSRFRSATFIQRSLFADGREELWYEAMQAPGMLRIDTSLEGRDAMIFRNDSLYVFQAGQRVSAVPMIHPLLLMLSDVYAISPAETLRKLDVLQFDTAMVRETIHEGRRTWVIGAAEGDTASNQIWIDHEHLYPVRMIQTATHPRPGRRETTFTGWQRVGGGWMESVIVMKVDGEDFLREEYRDIVPHAVFEPGLFEPDLYRPPQWVTPYVRPDRVGRLR